MIDPSRQNCCNNTGEYPLSKGKNKASVKIILAEMASVFDYVETFREKMLIS
jgi:hypothetical protein